MAFDRPSYTTCWARHYLTLFHATVVSVRVRHSPMYIIGAGGHAHSVAGLLLASGFTVAGAVASIEKGRDVFAVEFGGQKSLSVPLLLGDMGFRQLHPPARDVALAIGIGISPTRDNPGVSLRRRVFEEYATLGYKLPTLVDPSAVCRGTAGPGAQILAGAIVQPGVVIGANAVLNTRATVDHDCHVGDHAFLGPGATLCGNVTVGEGALIGAGAIVLPGIILGAGVVVRAGTVVASNTGGGNADQAQS